MFNQCPIGGKRNKAAAFSIKMVPSATVISLSLALITGPKAAMALPPQMAVPPETNRVVSLLILSSLPNSNPSPMVIAIEKMVNIMPVLPAEIACSIFMPNPKPTTEACNKILVNTLLCCINGFPIVSATRRPNNSANPGERNGITKSSNTKMISRFFCDSCS